MIARKNADLSVIRNWYQKPLPAEHLNINNTNDNPKRFILLLT